MSNVIPRLERQLQSLLSLASLLARKLKLNPFLYNWKMNCQNLGYLVRSHQPTKKYRHDTNTTSIKVKRKGGILIQPTSLKFNLNSVYRSPPLPLNKWEKPFCPNSNEQVIRNMGNLKRNQKS
jgi:hypothetical protein